DLPPGVLSEGGDVLDVQAASRSQVGRAIDVGGRRAARVGAEAVDEGRAVVGIEIGPVQVGHPAALVDVASRDRAAGQRTVRRAVTVLLDGAHVAGDRAASLIPAGGV